MGMEVQRSNVAKKARLKWHFMCTQWKLCKFLRTDQSVGVKCGGIFTSDNDNMPNM